MPAIVIYIVRVALIFSKKQQPAERKVVQTDNSAAVVINSTIQEHTLLTIILISHQKAKQLNLQYTTNLKSH